MSPTAHSRFGLRRRLLAAVTPTPSKGKLPDGSSEAGSSRASYETTEKGVDTVTQTSSVKKDITYGATYASPSAPTASVSSDAPLRYTENQATIASTLIRPYAHANDLWVEAFESLNLNETQKALLKAFIDDPPADCPKGKNLVEDVQNKIDNALQNQNQSSTARNITERTVSALNKFVGVVDVAVSFDPAHAALPWAAVRVFLVAFTARSELRDQLLAGISKVAALLMQCDVYRQLYMAADPEVRPSESYLERLRISIIQVYKVSQKFLCYAARQQQNNASKVLAVFKLEDMRSYIDGLCNAETQLSRDVEDCEKSCHLSDRLGLKELSKLCTELHQLVHDQLSHVNVILTRVDQEQQLRVLKWISPVAFGAHHENIRDKRSPGTCRWLLEDESFLDWRDSSSSSVLWLHGYALTRVAGTGKSVLTSGVIEYLQGLRRNSSDIGCAFFYCNRIERERGRHDEVLRSYLRQLSDLPGSDLNLPESLLGRYYEGMRKETKLDIDACKHQILESLNLFGSTYIVLDALDECEMQSQSQLIDTFEFLWLRAEQMGRPLKIFISSRPDPDIELRCKDWPSIEVRATKNLADIERFLREELPRHKRWRMMSPTFKEEIVHTLVNRSDGMFQWAKLQVDQLLRLYIDDDIKARLGNLPVGLKAAYDEMYREVSEIPYAKGVLDRACMWVMSAIMPIPKNWLSVMVNLSTDAVANPPVDEDQVLRICNNLLVFDKSSGRWRFAHLSVAEYFEGEHFGQLEAHCHAAKACLNYLLSAECESTWGKDKVQFDRTSPEFDRIFYLNFYVCGYWPNHVQMYEMLFPWGKADGDPLLVELLKRFIGSPLESSHAYKEWYRQSRYSSWRTIWIGDLNDDVALSVMCRFSFYWLLRDWWDSIEIDFGYTVREDANYLLLAAESGNKLICDILLQQGADPNLATAGRGETALISSMISEQRNSGCMELLIKKGADPNLLSDLGPHGSALAAAVSHQDVEVMAFLMDNGADPNLLLTSGLYGTALVAAAASCNTMAVKLLIERGADPHLLPEVGIYGSALAAAAAHQERIETIDLLIEKGCDPNLLLSTGLYGSALAAATYTGRYEVMRFLISKGADPDLLLATGSHGSALALVAFQASQASATPELYTAMEILIEQGADPNLLLKSGYYGSALVTAAARTRFEDKGVVKFLIDKGADPNVLPNVGLFGSALSAACYFGSVSCVKTLLLAGAIPDSILSVGNFSTALEAAEAMDDDELGSDPEERSRKHRDKAETVALLRSYIENRAGSP